jgi:hypothetical protein
MSKIQKFVTLAACLQFCSWAAPDIQDVTEEVAISIGTIADLVTDEDTPTRPVALELTSANTPIGELLLTGRSSNPALLPHRSLLFSVGKQSRHFLAVPAENQHGTAVVTITATDENGATAQTSFTVTVLSVNDLPVISTFTNITVNRGELVNPMEFEIGDIETEASRLIVKATSTNERLLPRENIVVAGTGAERVLMLLPAASVIGTSRVSIIVEDEDGGMAKSEFLLTVNGENRHPTISLITAQTAVTGSQAGPIEFVVDDEEDGPEALVIQARSSNPAVVQASKIQIVGRARERALMIDLAGAAPGTTEITITVEDPEGLAVETSFLMTVTPLGTRPTADELKVEAVEDTPLLIMLSGSDPRQQPLAFSIVNPPAKGVLTGIAPELLYTPLLNETGTDRFTYKVSNGLYESSIAVVEIEILAVNDPPVALPLALVVLANGEVSITLAGEDPDGDELAFQIESQPALGTLTGVPPQLVYRPHAGATGVDIFTYKASDGELVSELATVTIEIKEVNRAPLASSQVITLKEDTIQTVKLSGRDPDGDELEFEVMEFPKKGNLLGIGSDLIYIPNANANGLDQFTFQVSDGILDSAPGIVSFIIIPVNDAPEAVAQFIMMDEDTEREITLEGRDVDGDELSFIILTIPRKGSLSGTAPNLTYRPHANAHGFDSFTFRVSDGLEESRPETVSIAIQPVNDAPRAQAQFVGLAEDTRKSIVLEGTDVDGDALEFSIVNPPKNGTLSGTPPIIAYTPNPNFFGFDSFTFQVDDGELKSEPATVTLSVAPVNDQPTAEGQFRMVLAGESVEIELKGRDVDGDPLRYIVTTLPMKGWLTGEPPFLRYYAKPGERGDDSFTFKVNDGELDSLIATVFMVILPGEELPHDPIPAAYSQSISVLEDEEVGFVLSGGGGDGGALNYRIVSGPHFGVLSGAPPELLYTPARDFFGEDELKFVVQDAARESLPATVRIMVEPVNDPPIISVIEDQEVSLNESLSGIRFFVEDPDNASEELVVTVESSDPGLVPIPNITISGAGRERFLEIMPARDQSGSAIITLRVSDLELEAAARFTLTVMPLPEEPARIRLVRPAADSWHAPGRAIALEAELEAGHASVIAFYANGELVGKAEENPFVLDWEPAVPGYYQIRGEAWNGGAAAAASDTVDILVAEPAGRVAIVSDGNEPVVERMVEYLLELSLESIRVSRQAAREMEFREFDLVIWNAGTSIDWDDLRTVEEIIYARAPVYFIGSELLSLSEESTEFDRERWSELVHLKSGGSVWFDRVQMSPTLDHPVLDGPHGRVADFEYSRFHEFGVVQTGLAGEVVLGRSGNVDLLVAFADPRHDGRTLSQYFSLVMDGEGAGEQRKLFENAIFWLLRKPCDRMNLSVEIEVIREEEDDEIELAIRVEHSGDCPALGVELICELPEGLRLVELQSPGGEWSDSNGSLHMNLGKFLGGQWKWVRLRVSPELPGEYLLNVMVGAPAGEGGRREVAFTVEGLTEPEPLTRLGIHRGGGDWIELEIYAAKGNPRVEVSTDLINWTPVELGELRQGGVVYQESTAGAKQRFFRLNNGGGK